MSVFTHAQAAATLTAMQAQWAAAFPPLDDPLRLAGWLVTVHTGSMFAYPCGGERGASSLTLLLFAVGAGVLWCRAAEGDRADLPGAVRAGPRGRGDQTLPLRRRRRRIAGAGHAIPGAEHLPARRPRGRRRSGA